MKSVSGEPISTCSALSIAVPPYPHVTLALAVVNISAFAVMSPNSSSTPLGAVKKMLLTLISVSPETDSSSRVVTLKYTMAPFVPRNPALLLE